MLRINHLCGFGAFRHRISNLGFVTSVAGGNVASIVAPATVQRGDILIFWDWVSNSAIPAAVIPPGFTQIASTPGVSAVRAVSSYKLADGSESGAVLTGMPAGSFGGGKLLAQFRGVGAAALSLTLGSVSSEMTQVGNPGPKTVTCNGVAGPLVVIGCYGSSGPVEPRAFSPAKNGEIVQVTPNPTLYLAWRIDQFAGQDTTIDMDDGGDGNTVHTFYLQAA